MYPFLYYDVFELHGRSSTTELLEDYVALRCPTHVWGPFCADPTLGDVVTRLFPSTPARHVVLMLVSVHHMTLTCLFSQDGAVWARHCACAAVHGDRSDHGSNTVFIETSCCRDVSVYIVDVDAGSCFPAS